MATTSKQRLALAICDFLSTSLTDGTLQSEDKDSIDIAVNCISETFGVDPNDKAAVSQAIGTQNLLQIYSVYEKLKNATKPAGGAEATWSSSAAAASQDSKPTEVSVETKAQADALKSKGNAAMAAKDYPTAIDLYTQALSLVPGNAVYLSNRAAAHSAARDHASARADAEAAVAADPTYTKAWSRLGLAKFALGDARGAMDAYAEGIKYEGSGGGDAMRKGYETAKRRVELMEADEAGAGADRDVGGDAGRGAGGPNLSDLAGMFGGGRGGGAPDFASIMSNPMFASMAQSMMSNPDMMSNLMSNPRLREMASQFGSGGGLPDMSSLMSDPAIADMARSMMGGGGRGAGGAPPS